MQSKKENNQNRDKELISIVILNYNGGNVLKDCLNSISNQVYRNYETIVIDNGSTDGSIKNIEKNFKKIILIKNKKNKGYAGGNNQGIKKAKGNRILLLNNDTVLEKNFLKGILKNPADIVGAKNYYSTKDKVIWAVGAKLNPLLFRTFLVGMKKKDGGQFDKKYSPDQIVGSAMLIKKNVFDKIGYLDEDYFCYYEETEWQLRAKNAGFNIGFEPSAVLWHKVAYSSGGGSNPLSDYYLIRNRLYLIKKYQKSVLKPLSYIFVFLESIVKMVLHMIKLRKNFFFPFSGFFDFLKNRKGAKK